MRKPLAVRILALAAVYCAVFIFIVILQFSKKGNFTLSVGEMTLRGRYSQSAEETANDDKRPLTDGIRALFGGLEFNLKGDGGKGLFLTGDDGRFIFVNPVSMTLTDNKVSFELPGGTILSFNVLSSERGVELQTSAMFAENITALTIPIESRRSSLIHDNGQLGILHNGMRYVFGRSSQELESGQLVLSAENSVISYRSRGKQKVFDPSDFIIAGAQNSQDYESALQRWREQSYLQWIQNASSLRNEDDVIAYFSEALRNNSYRTAAASIPRDFVNNPQRGYRSSGYLGGMARAYRAFSAEERGKLSSITSLINEGSIDILKEAHILDYLLSRNNTALANNAASVIRGINHELLTLDYCPGLLEAYSDFNRQRIQPSLPFDQFIEHILLLVSENIHLNTENNFVYVSASEEIDFYYNLRLGKALLDWALDTQNSEWAAVGRSLVLSALSGGRTGSGMLYPIVRNSDYYPRAVRLGLDNLWAWTISPSVRAAYAERDININVSYFEGLTHYIMIHGIRPFIKLQIHGIDFRSDPQFEIYDSSGWTYYSQDQVLVMKLRHRSAIENIRIVYTVELPPPVVETKEDTNDTDNEYDTTGY